MLIDKLLNKSNNFPKTIIYNEGWLLRLLLNWIDEKKMSLSKTDYCEEFSWFSEGLIASPFHHRTRKDSLAEGKTHIDGISGHFEIKAGTKADINLNSMGSIFSVYEAKLFSTFSPGTKNFPSYNQVSRNIACMAYLFSNQNTINYKSISFSAVYPNERINEQNFLIFLEKDIIQKDVLKRIDSYNTEFRRSEYELLQNWYHNHFLKFLSIIEIRSITWESILSEISTIDHSYGVELDNFYQNCLRYNRKYNKAFRADG